MLKVKQGATVLVKFTWEPVSTIPGGKVAVNTLSRPLTPQEITEGKADVTAEVQAERVGTVELQLWRAEGGSTWKGKMTLESDGESEDDSAENQDEILFMDVDFGVVA